MPQERRSLPCKLAINSATGFWADFGDDRAAGHGHQETARFPGDLSPPPRRIPASHTFCVGTLDLASVSTTVRPVSNTVRRTPPTVSANLRRKVPLIARPPHFDCAPLQLPDPHEAGLGLPVHPHMLRHSTGFKLANDGQDTRAIQHYLGHRNIQHTVVYTHLASNRFNDFWKD